MEPELKIWPSVFQLCVWERRRTVNGRVSQVHHSFSHMRGHTWFFFPVSPLCSFVFSDNNYGLVADDKGNCRIPSESVLYFDREKAEPREKRETCHF